MPYITASIILQLLTVVVPSLEKLSKEGEVGQARITQYTRYVTVGLAFAQSIGYVFLFRSLSRPEPAVIPDFDLQHIFLIVMSLTAGTVLVMWMGELITQRGIGNGISLMIFASIVSRLPGAAQTWYSRTTRSSRSSCRSSSSPSSRPSCSCRKASGASRCSTQSASSGVAWLRRPDLPAVARQHGGRHPGHLRRLADGVPADRRPADPHALVSAGRRFLLTERLALHRRRSDPDHRLHLLLHRGHLQSGRPGREPEEVRWLHPRRQTRDGRRPSSSIASWRG